MSVYEQRVPFAFSFPPSTDLTAPVKSIIITGNNPDIDTASVPESVWGYGGAYSFPASAAVCTFSSSSANDSSAGTGANYILIEGLNSKYEQIYETLATNGVSVVTGTSLFYRVNSVRVVSSGSGKTNAGAITVNISGSPVAYLTAGDSFSQTAVYTVPVNHTLFLTNTTVGVTRSSNAVINVTSKVYVPSTNTVVNGSDIPAANGLPTILTNNSPSYPRIPEKCDFWYNVDYCPANNTVVSITIRGLLVSNNWIPKFLR